MAALLLQGASADDTAGLIAQLLGLPKAVVLLALKLADHEGRSRRGTKHAPRPRGSGPIQREQARTEAAYRAAFVAASARRIAGRMPAGADVSPADAIGPERRYLALHERARRARQEAAREVAQAAEVVGLTDGVPWLGWYAYPDDRVTPECKRADKANFRADQMPLIGWPGTLHGGTCRCRPGPPFPTSRTVDGSMAGLLAGASSKPRKRKGRKARKRRRRR